MGIHRTSVGVDVHAHKVVAAAIVGEVEVVRQFGGVDQDGSALLGWLVSLPGPVSVVYEAGPTGYGLYRWLIEEGIECVVAAPSRLLRASGDRVKTDRRDAIRLARMLRLGEVTAVEVPTVAQEAARDLTRAREDARANLMRARHRLSKLLLRQGLVYRDGKGWTRAHDAWLRRVRFDQVGTRAAFEAYYEDVIVAAARRDRLDAAIMVLAADSEFTDVTRRLACLRGVSTLTGFTLAVEIGRWDRFTGASIGAYLGLVPSEHSTGSKTARGSITKTGNGHARRLLVEAAQHHAKPYRASVGLQRRWKAAPGPVVARAHAGNQRLHHRWVAMSRRQKKHNVVDIAIARELAGWCWSLATMTPDTDPRLMKT